MSRRRERERHTREAAASLDEAFLTLRRDAGPLLALWLLAWAPQAAAAWSLIDAVAARDEPAIPGRAALFVAALPWRWLVMAGLQARVMRRRGVPVERGLRRVRALLTVTRVRVLAAATAQLGAVLLLPPLWMLYVASFAGPRALTAADPDAAPRSREARGLLPASAWSVRHTRPLLRHAAQVSLLVLIAGIVLVACFYFGLYLMQAWLNVELATDTLVWSTPVLLMTLGLVLWALLDLVHGVSAVPLLERLENRHTGGDLGRRLSAVAAAAERIDEPLERAA